MVCGTLAHVKCYSYLDPEAKVTVSGSEREMGRARDSEIFRTIPRPRETPAYTGSLDKSGAVLSAPLALLTTLVKGLCITCLCSHDELRGCVYSDACTAQLLQAACALCMLSCPKTTQSVYVCV